MIKASIIIPSFNGRNKLKELIPCLCRQSNKDFEAVFVLDGSTDYSKELLETVIKSSFFPVKIICQPNRGRAASRNSGLKVAIGSICVFLDDDMLPEPYWLEKHILHHRMENDSLLSGPGFRDPKKAKTPFSNYIIKKESHWKKGRETKMPVEFKNFAFSACNLSGRKSIFEKLGGFDERLTDAEDFDLGLRAILYGFAIYYDPGLLAWHNDWPTLESFAKRHIQYTLGKNQLLRIHPEYALLFPKLKIRVSSFFKVRLLLLADLFFRKILSSNNNNVGVFPEFARTLYFRLRIAAITAKSIFSNN